MSHRPSAGIPIDNVSSEVFGLRSSLGPVIREVRFHERLGIRPEDVEITIFETPKHSWGFHGLPGDEHSLNYKVDV